MGSAVVSAESNGVVSVAHAGLSQEQIELVKDTICRGATNDELALFVQVCNRTGLDPFAKQVYAVKRWDSKLKREVMACQVSIDGLRLTAERSGKYAGQIGPLWCGHDGEWRDVWLSSEFPAAAKVGVLRRDFAEPLWAVAHWVEYVQTTKEGAVTSMWREKATIMLAKCAESLGLRKAFPMELSGLYTSEEMRSADDVVEATFEREQFASPPAPVQPKASGTDPKTRKALRALMDRLVKAPTPEEAARDCDALALAYRAACDEDAIRFGGETELDLLALLCCKAEDPAKLAWFRNRLSKSLAEATMNGSIEPGGKLDTNVKAALALVSERLDEAGEGEV